MDQQCDELSAPSSAPQEDIEIWTRIYSKRTKELSQINSKDIQEIVEPLLKKGDLPPPTATDPHERFGYIMQQYLFRSLDTTVHSKKRRHAWNTVKSLLAKTDKLVAAASTSDDETMPMNTEIANENTEMSSATNKTSRWGPRISQTNNSNNDGTNQHSSDMQNGHLPDPRQIAHPTLNKEKAFRKTKIVARKTTGIGKGIRNGEIVAASNPQNNQQQHTATTSFDSVAAVNEPSKRPEQQTASLHQRNIIQNGRAPAITAPLTAGQAAQLAAARGQQEPPPQQQQQQHTDPTTLSEDNLHLEETLGTLPPSTDVSTSSNSSMGVVLSATASNRDAAPKQGRVSNQLSSARAPTPTLAEPSKAFQPSEHKQPVREVIFAEDLKKPFLSGACNGRSAMGVSFTPQSLTRDEEKQVFSRLVKWDPFWGTCQPLIMGRTSKIHSHFPAVANAISTGEKPVTAAEVSFCPSKDLPKDLVRQVKGWGVKQTASPKHGELRVLLRMLPLRSPGKKEKKKRADTHLWPKGIFVQVNCLPVGIRHLRRQQSHDSSLWKGNSHALNLTSLIHNFHDTCKISLCAYDTEDYAFCIALCRYVSVDSLVDVVKTKSVHRLSLKDSIDRAIECINRSTFFLLDDDGSNADKASDNALTFSLICPMSKTLIRTPVRGLRCKHFQCFDLKNYIETNEWVSGGRWRCAVCEEFVSLRDLQHCGLYENVLAQYATQAHAARDRVKFMTNGTWFLMDETKKRYSSGGDGGRKRPNDGPQQDWSSSKRAKQSHPEVINLD